MTLHQRYQEAITQKGFVSDARQAEVVQALGALRIALSKPQRWWHTSKPIQGVYMVGPVGRGKTFLMDLFFDNLKDVPKKRTHFQVFMRMIHHKLRLLQGQANPIDALVKDLSQKLRVLCLDEFYIEDIADAMILDKLLTAMFARHMVLVTTSNTMPDNLYEHGLTRDRFLPAIERIKLHCQVVSLVGGQDYRTQGVCDTEEHAITQLFAELTQGEIVLDKPIELCGRTVKVRGRTGKVIWFDAAVICGKGRGSDDYLDIAKQYNTLCVGGLRPVSPMTDDIARRFIALVDALYDAQVRLVFNPGVDVDGLYHGERLAKAFLRTHSRLTEMVSQ